MKKKSKKEHSAAGDRQVCLHVEPPPCGLPFEVLEVRNREFDRGDKGGKIRSS